MEFDLKIINRISIFHDFHEHFIINRVRVSRSGRQSPTQTQYLGRVPLLPPGHLTIARFLSPSWMWGSRGKNYSKCMPKILRLSTLIILQLHIGFGQKYIASKMLLMKWKLYLQNKKTNLKLQPLGLICQNFIQILKF